MKDFLIYLLNEILPSTEGIKVEEVINGTDIRLQIHAPSKFLGMIIGKQGNTIKSLRAILKSKAIKENVRVSIDVIEPNA